MYWLEDSPSLVVDALYQDYLYINEWMFRFQKKKNHHTSHANYVI